MTAAELIAKQAKELVEIHDEVTELRADISRARANIYGIGGPLNDNKLGYSPQQKINLQRIPAGLRGVKQSEVKPLWRPTGSRINNTKLSHEEYDNRLSWCIVAVTFAVVALSGYIIISVYDARIACYEAAKINPTIARECK